MRDGSIVTKAAAAGGFRTVRVGKWNGARTALAATRAAALRGVALRRIDPRRTVAAIGLRMRRLQSEGHGQNTQACDNAQSALHLDLPTSAGAGNAGTRRTFRTSLRPYWLPAVGCLACRDAIGSHGRMRTSLIIACAIAAFAAGAQAQDAFNPCRQIKDDGKRLKCYDRLDRSSPNAQERPRQSRPGGDTAWTITDEKSPLDDSPMVSAALSSSDDRAHLLMRCKDRKTEVAVSMTGFIKCESDVRVIYRIDQEQPVETPWRSH